MAAGATPPARAPGAGGGGAVHATGRYRRWRGSGAPGAPPGAPRRRLSFSAGGGERAPWVVLPPAFLLFFCLARRTGEIWGTSPPVEAAATLAAPLAPVTPTTGDLDALLGLRLARGSGGRKALTPGSLETVGFADAWSGAARGHGPRGFEFTAASAVGRGHPDPPPPAAGAPTVVTLASSELHPGAVRLAASLHFWHPEASMRVYHDGPRLSQADARVLAGLRGVRVVALEDVWTDLVEADGAPLAGSATRPRGEVRTWEPLVLMHALLDSPPGPPGAVYVPPWLSLGGWADLIWRGLARDGAFLPCPRRVGDGESDTASAVCVQGLQGFVHSGAVPPPALEAQARCALQGPGSESCAPFGGARSGKDKEILVNVTAASREGGQSGRELLAGEDWYYSRGAWASAVTGTACHDPRHLHLGSLDARVSFTSGRQSIGCSGMHAADYSCRAQRRPVEASKVRVVWASPDQGQGHGPGAGKEGGAAEGGIASRGGLGLGVPFRSGFTGGTDSISFRHTPFAAHFMTSFGEALKAEKGVWPPHATVYVGLQPVDEEKYFGSPQKVQEVAQWVAGIVEGLPLSVEFFTTGAPESDAVLWNLAFLRTFSAEHDFYLAAHTDSVFEAPDWASLHRTMRFLEVSELAGFGVAGPLDAAEPVLITHPAVHRTHHEVFGHLFPPTLAPPEGFAWLSNVYGPRFTFVDSEYRVRKPGLLAARYPASCRPRPEYIAQALDEAGPALMRWLAARPASQDAIARETLHELLRELSPSYGP